MADEPKGKATARDYTVLARAMEEPVSEEGRPMWVEYGTFAATSQDGALKAICKKHPELQADDIAFVAIPPSSWEEVTREVEMVPREKFRPIGEQAKQAATAASAEGKGAPDGDE